MNRRLWYGVSIVTMICLCLQGCKNSTEYDHRTYRNILQSYPEYAYEETRALPTFIYAEPSDADLMRIYTTFNLAAIAGEGNQLSQIMNLMHWVHNTVPHDGLSSNPYPVNTFEIVRVTQEEGRGVNCRMIAIMLNEIYLASGFKSRYVTCMPAETDFTDCHVINAVYVDDLHKWIYIDASFEGFFTDETGTFLSVQEVRQRLQHDQFVKANEKVNRNGKPFHDYRGYMMKNLFRLECPVQNVFDYESAAGKNYIQLIPQGYRTSFESTVTAKETTWYTSNPEAFWEP